MQTASAAGFYGKLPCKGDFLQRSVAQEFVDAWDPWLQQCLLTSREQLQERWLDAYLTSPVWRFALADGVCGSGAYAGVVVPSVDRVGRYFPLTLVAQLNAEDCLLDLASDGARQWFDSVESLVLGALQAHDLDLPVFEEQVATLGGPFREPDTAEAAYLRTVMRQSAVAHQGQWQVPLQSVHSLQRAVNVFASLELERALRPLTLWWTDGSDAVVPCWFCNRGLPPPREFAAMIAGRGPAAAQAPSLVTASPGPEPGSDSAYPPESSEIIACHAAINRRVDTPQSLYFVSRPEVGLWGLSCGDGHEAADDAAQTVADVLHDIPTAGSLTALAEEVRRALESLSRREVEARAVVFLRRAGECAVVCAGAVQAVRVRGLEVTTIEGSPSSMQGYHDHSEPPQADLSLLDLLTAPPVDADAPVVHYETLRSGDAWVLWGDALFDTRPLATLPALVAEHPTAGDAMLAAVGRLLRQGTGIAAQELPLMVLAAVPPP